MKAVACTLGPTEMSARLAASANLCARGLIGAVPTSKGYRLRFAPGVRTDLEDLIAAESRCCSFMEFDLKREGNSLILEVVAPEAGRPLVAELFGLT